MNVFFKVEFRAITETTGEVAEYERFYTSLESAKAKIKDELESVYQIKDIEPEFTNITESGSYQYASVCCNIDNFFKATKGNTIIAVSLYIERIRFSD